MDWSRCDDNETAEADRNSKNENGKVPLSVTRKGKIRTGGGGGGD